MTRPGLFPVLPAPAVSAFGVTIFPSNDSHKNGDLRTRSALICMVLGVSTYMFVESIVCTFVCVDIHVCTYVYLLLLYTYVHTVINLAISYIQFFMVACKTAKVCQVT